MTREDTTHDARTNKSKLYNRFVCNHCGNEYYNSYGMGVPTGWVVIGNTKKLSAPKWGDSLTLHQYSKQHNHVHCCQVCFDNSDSWEPDFNKPDVTEMAVFLPEVKRGHP